jgi:hypothetical protein
MTAAAGIRKHGEVAVNALLKEFCQLDDKSVFEPLDASTLSREQKAAALRSISLIKEKRCGKIKGRTCADGRKQRLLYDKSDTSSPTISLDALLMTLIIDAKERRDVATADVVGAYLNADMKDFVVLRMEAEAVDIMCSSQSCKIIPMDKRACIPFPQTLDQLFPFTTCFSALQT